MTDTFVDFIHMRGGGDICCMREVPLVQRHGRPGVSTVGDEAVGISARPLSSCARVPHLRGDVIMSTEFIARAGSTLWPATRAKELEARRLTKLCVIARGTRTRAQIAHRGVYRARWVSKAEREERARERGLHGQGAPLLGGSSAGHHTFEGPKNSDEWPILLQNRAIETVGSSGDLGKEWAELIKEYVRQPAPWTRGASRSLLNFWENS